MATVLTVAHYVWYRTVAARLTRYSERAYTQGRHLHTQVLLPEQVYLRIRMRPFLADTKEQDEPARAAIQE